MPQSFWSVCVAFPGVWLQDGSGATKSGCLDVPMYQRLLYIINCLHSLVIPLHCWLRKSVALRSLWICILSRRLGAERVLSNVFSGFSGRQESNDRIANIPGSQVHTCMQKLRCKACQPLDTAWQQQRQALSITTARFRSCGLVSSARLHLRPLDAGRPLVSTSVCVMPRPHRKRPPDAPIGEDRLIVQTNHPAAMLINSRLQRPNTLCCHSFLLSFLLAATGVTEYASPVSPACGFKGLQRC